MKFNKAAQVSSGHSSGTKWPQGKARPALAMGLFVFLKSQLEGIKERAESAVASDA